MNVNVVMSDILVACIATDRSLCTIICVVNEIFLVRWLFTEDALVGHVLALFIVVFQVQILIVVQYHEAL